MTDDLTVDGSIRSGSEGTYEKTTTRVVVGEGASDYFEVNIGL